MIYDVFVPHWVKSNTYCCMVLT